MPLNSKYFKSPDLHITFSGTPSWFPELVRGPHTSPRALFISFPQDLLLNSSAAWHPMSSWGARPLPTSLQYHLRTQLSVRQENHEMSQQPSINIHSLPSVDHRQHDWRAARIKAVVQVDIAYSSHARTMSAPLLACRIYWMGGSMSHIDLAFKVIPIKIRGSGRWPSRQSACWACIRTWVWIPST